MAELRHSTRPARAAPQAHAVSIANKVQLAACALFFSSLGCSDADPGGGGAPASSEGSSVGGPGATLRRTWAAAHAEAARARDHSARNGVPPTDAVGAGAALVAALPGPGARRFGRAPLAVDRGQLSAPGTADESEAPGACVGAGCEAETAVASDVAAEAVAMAVAALGAAGSRKSAQPEAPAIATSAAVAASPLSRLLSTVAEGTLPTEERLAGCTAARIFASRSRAGMATCACTLEPMTSANGSGGEGFRSWKPSCG